MPKPVSYTHLDVYKRQMEDWITGVKKFLLAEKIKVADMKTEEGKQFFSALADEVNA